jgi:plasmid stabilization system protein ParE
VETYTVKIDVLAQRDIDQFYEYLREYNEDTACKYAEAFYDVVERLIAVNPHAFPTFRETGPPYRAFLFSVSRRSKFWIIYTIDDSRREVSLLRFWNTARKPGSHGLM